jgi:hypothetical protein
MLAEREREETSVLGFLSAADGGKVGRARSCLSGAFLCGHSELHRPILTAIRTHITAHTKDIYSYKREREKEEEEK